MYIYYIYIFKCMHKSVLLLTVALVSTNCESETDWVKTEKLINVNIRKTEDRLLLSVL